jgi:endonuclease YncB( thermonuclease family)
MIRRVAVLRVLLLAALFQAAPAPAEPQTRPHHQRVSVPTDRIRVVDGDTVVIAWAEENEERVRILGIDTPEVAHPDHFLSEDQPFGPEASAFAKALFAAAASVEILRSDQTDPYGRSLAYLFLDGRNYSVLVLRARLAYETVSHYGDNGLPEEAAACRAAYDEATANAPLPFEPPYQFRRAMRAKQEAAGRDG